MCLLQKGLKMALGKNEIKLVGTLYRSPQQKRPTIYLDDQSARLLRSWREEQKIFTRWKDGLHPASGHRSPVLYPSEGILGALGDGDQAWIVLGIRSDRRGPGIRFLEIGRESS